MTAMNEVVRVYPLPTRQGVLVDNDDPARRPLDQEGVHEGKARCSRPDDEVVAAAKIHTGAFMGLAYCTTRRVEKIVAQSVRILPPDAPSGR